MEQHMSMSRRELLRHSIVGAAGLHTFGVSRAGTDREPPPSELVRLGVIGTGFRGKYLIGNLPPAFRVVALCDCSASQMDDPGNPGTGRRTHGQRA